MFLALVILHNVVVNISKHKSSFAILIVSLTSFYVELKDININTLNKLLQKGYYTALV